MEITPTDALGCFGVADFPVKSTPKGSWTYPPMQSTRDGGVRRWQIGYDAHAKEVVTVYGKVDGAKQVARVEVAPKGKRNHSEQAVIVINGKVKVKTDKDGFVFPERETEKMETAEHYPEGAKEPYGRPRPVPMLAKDLAGLKRALAFPVAVQPKLDGIRCMIDCVRSPDGDEVALRLTSRGGKDFKHLETLFIDEALQVLNNLAPDAILDGELVVKRKGGGGVDFQTTTSAVRTTKTITETALTDMQYCVFGLHLPSSPKASFEERAAQLEAAFRVAETERSRLRRLAFVQHFLCEDFDAVKRCHAEFVCAGEEGAMIYNLRGVYAPNKRGDDLLKFKTFDEFEGEVIGVEGGKGREKNAALVVIKCPNGKVVTMHPEGPIAEREKWLADPTLVVGKKMTYTCQGLTTAGVPRFPVAKCIRDYE